MVKKKPTLYFLFKLSQIFSPTHNPAKRAVAMTQTPPLSRSATPDHQQPICSSDEAICCHRFATIFSNFASVKRFA